MTPRHWVISYPVTWLYPLRKPENLRADACESENILPSLRLLISMCRGGKNVFIFLFSFCALYRSIYTLHTQISRSEVSSELVPLAMALFFVRP
jgi:hypothetical protein